MLIKDIKRNLSEALIKTHLPDPFLDFHQHISALGYYDAPDYDKLIRLFEKAKE